MLFFVPLQAAQEPPALDPPAGGAWDWLHGLAAEPAVVEVLLVAAAGALLWLLYGRVARAVRDARARGAVKDYLLGVEMALAGDPVGARQRLERVLAEDPENHFARLLYGEVLAELGDPGAAHKEHHVLKHSFGVDSHRNELSLARCLLDTGRPAEAAVVASEAAQRAPRDVATLELLFTAQLGAGFPEEAGRTGRQLLPLVEQPDRREWVRRRAAVALALAGSVKLRADDRDAAEALCREAGQLSPDEPDVVQLRARLAFARSGREGLRTLGVGRSSAARPSPSPQPAGAAPLALLAPGPPIAAGAALVVAEPYRCGACGSGLLRAVVLCPACGAKHAASPREPALTTAIESPLAVLDEVEANRNHVRRRIEELVAGSAVAAEDLASIGTDAIEELLAVACRDAAAAPPVEALLRSMGPEALPALFAAYQQMAGGTLHKLTGRRLARIRAEVLGRVVQGWGRDALPHFEGLLDTEDHDLRKVLLDYTIGLGDEQALREVLTHFPPVEVIHRLNAAGAEALRRLLCSLQPGGFLAAGLLVESTFRREEALVAALEHAAHPEVLVEVLLQRGYTPQLTDLLIDALSDPARATAAGQVLDGFGLAGLDALLSAYADLDRPAALREVLRQRIAGLGPAAVARVCALFGPSPSSLDGDLLALLAAIGPAAAEPLAQAFQATTLVERLSARLVGRHSHRRVAIIRALGGLGARPVLQRLREAESDANLKLRLAQALHTLDRQAAPGDAAEDAAEEGSHGQAG